MSDPRKRTRETELALRDERQAKKLKKGHKTQPAATTQSPNPKGQRTRSKSPGIHQRPEHEILETAPSGHARLGNVNDRSRSNHEQSGWTFTDSIGGKLADLEPILTNDEEHILLAYSSFVNVYSISTQSLVGTLDAGLASSDRLAGISRSPTNQDHVYLATTDGLVQCWDWSTARKVAEWRLDRSITRVATAILPGHDDDVFFTVESVEDSWLVTAHFFWTGNELRKPNVSRPLRKLHTNVTKFCVSADGRHICYAYGKRFAYGRHTTTPGEDSTHLSYKWREFSCDATITCLDLHVSNVQKDKSRAAAVVGSQLGPLYIYRNLESTMNDSDGIGIVPLKLHWHRMAVKSVKWSIDGNYIISGGMETVLLIWQVDTGTKQALPHLSSRIVSLTVSKSGAFYGIRLGDNSCMVLSTADLSPVFDVSHAQVPFQSTSDSRSKFSRRRVPLTCMGQNDEKMLIACSSSLPENTTDARSQLQTISFATGSQLARQALTRTNVTNRIEGPEGNQLKEPDVKLLSLSHDEQWMATVDEWQSVSSNQGNDRYIVKESFLKFWHYNIGSQDWSLITRIDEPHFLHNVTANTHNKVLDLAPLHGSLCFLSFGLDKCLRLWKPTYRRRNGIEVLAKDGSVAVVWQCSKSLHIPLPLVESIKQARIVVSEDDSLAVLGIGSGSPEVSSASSEFRCIDLRYGTIKSVYSEPTISFFSELLISGRYLVLISKQIALWDMIEQSRVNSEKFGELNNNQLFSHGAINHRFNTIAVVLSSVPGPESSHENHQILIYNLLSRELLFQQSLPGAVYAIVGSKSKNSFSIIYCNGCLQRLEMRSSNPPVLGIDTSSSSQKMEMPSLFMQRASKDVVMARSTNEASIPASEYQGDNSSFALGKIFGPDTAGSYPSVYSMFQRLAKSHAMQSTA